VVTTGGLRKGVLQFPHPGAEHRPTADEMDWNRGEHRRKFLLSPGSVLEDDGAVHRHEDLCLWGEWEAPSLVVHRWPTRGRLAGLPRVLHRPRLAPLPSTGIVQNSDPLVFGNAFRYSNCRQSTRYTHRPQKQQCLDLGSVVLFGSKQGGAFVLDTCLVVRSRLSYTLDDAPVVDGIVETSSSGRCGAAAPIRAGSASRPRRSPSTPAPPRTARSTA